MANKNLLTANQAYIDQQNYNVGEDIVNQAGKVMAGYELFKSNLQEEAMKESEELQADAVGVDLMSEESRDWTIEEFDWRGNSSGKS